MGVESRCLYLDMVMTLYRAGAFIYTWFMGLCAATAEESRVDQMNRPNQ